MTRTIVALAAVIAFSTLPAAQETIYKPGDGVTLPAVVKEVKPSYTREAMAARIEGTVTVKLVVRTDGTVGDVQVTQSLDKEHGLDNQAVQAAKQWEFKPGTKDGKPVPVQISLELTFTLK